LTVKERYFLFTPTGELNMTDTTEPAGAARFAAASYSNVIKVGAASAPLTLEERIATLEAVVKTIAEHSRAAAHSRVVAWLESAGARIEAAVKKVL
jgi:O-acetylhomoserine/O-acetylserine sulfhydrylase-like pyridoxal-dependent enzyme